MSAVWRWIVQRRLIEEPLRTALTVLGVTLGVAVFVGIRLASRSAMSSFAETVDAVTGRANLQVVSTSDGFDERIFETIRKTTGVAAAAPVVEVYVRARPGGAPVASIESD